MIRGVPPEIMAAKKLPTKEERQKTSDTVFTKRLNPVCVVIINSCVCAAFKIKSIPLAL